jgi:hypothetical protein
MEKCPLCKKHTVSYNSYYNAKACSVDGCTYVEHNGTPSMLSTRMGRHVRIAISDRNSANPPILEDHGAVMLK